MNKLGLLFGLIFPVLNLFAQPEANLEKYWNYKERLKNFAVTGDCQGCSILCGDRDGTIGRMDWSDATIQHGFYIATLAMEYQLLASHGFNTDATLEELWFAIEAFNRLDYTAESSWGCTNELNGFFLRDDVPFGFESNNYQGLSNADHLNKGLVPPPDGFRVKCVASGFNVYEFAAEESHDQVVGLFLGLRFVKEFLPETLTINKPFLDGEFTFVGEVKNISNRIIDYFQANDWKILNPCSGDCVQGVFQSVINPDVPCSEFNLYNLPPKTCSGTPCDCGGALAKRLALGFVKANCLLQGPGYALQCVIDHYDPVVVANTILWNTVHFTSFTDGLSTSLAAITNIWGQKTTAKKMVKRGIDHDSEFLILIHQILYGVTLDNNDEPITINDAYFECMLDVAPCRGIEQGQDNFEWTRPGRLRGKPKGDNISTMQTGLDYLFYFNAYNIVHPDYLGQSYKFIQPKEAAKVDILKENYDEFETKNFIASNTITGANSYFVDTDINEGTGNVNFIAAKEVALLPGFEAREGVSFSASIDPDIEPTICNEPSFSNCSFLRSSNFRMSDTSQTHSSQNAEDDPINDQLSVNHAWNFGIYPNPNSGQFTLTLPGETNATVQVYDLLGNLIYKSQAPNSKSQTIDISAHGKGVYFVRVVQGEQIFTQKLIHQ